MLSPYKGYVLLEEMTEETLPGGLAMPDKRDDAPMSGKLISQRIDTHKDDPTLIRGTIVYFRAFAGDKIVTEQGTYRLVHERDIIAYDGKGVK